MAEEFINTFKGDFLHLTVNGILEESTKFQEMVSLVGIVWEEKSKSRCGMLFYILLPCTFL